MRPRVGSKLPVLTTGAAVRKELERRELFFIVTRSEKKCCERIGAAVPDGVQNSRLTDSGCFILYPGIYIYIYIYICIFLGGWIFLY